MTGLYNRYLDDTGVFERMTPEPEEHWEAEQKQESNPLFAFLHNLRGDGQKETPKTSGETGSLLQRLHLSDIDLGDILLLAIVILLIIEGEHWELAIILGLIFVLGLLKDKGEGT